MDDEGNWSDADPRGRAQYPVEIHCHGLGGLDFSDLDRLDLRAVDAQAAAERVLCVPTVFLSRARLPRFVEVMREFEALAGELPYVGGFAVEGPLLSSSGGTPPSGAWQPTWDEWSRLCSCGPLGLRYVVLSPDFATAHSCLAGERDAGSFDLAWAVRTLVDNGVSPALGHFTKADPNRSADCVLEVLAINAEHETPVTVITDHLFNDMPLTFRHAWRGEAARRRRAAELEASLAVPWELDDLENAVGIVPATLIRAATAGDVMLCLNFDGEHVDLAHCKRALDVVGTKALIAMTDRTEVPSLAGQELHRRAASSLWYQGDDVVAAGSTPIDRQMANLRELGVDEDGLRALTYDNPRRALRL